MLSVAPAAVPERISALKNEVAELLNKLDQRQAAGPISADALLESREQVDDATLVLAELPGVEPNLMRQLIDQIRQKAPPAAVLLASCQGSDKVTLVAGVSKELQQRGVSAGKWIGPVAKAVGGGGGGRPDMAQAGGKKPDQLPAALEVARQTLGEMLAG